MNSAITQCANGQAAANQFEVSDDKHQEHINTKQCVPSEVLNGQHDQVNTVEAQSQASTSVNDNVSYVPKTDHVKNSLATVCPSALSSGKSEVNDITSMKEVPNITAKPAWPPTITEPESDQFQAGTVATPAGQQSTVVSQPALSTPHAGVAVITSSPAEAPMPQTSGTVDFQPLPPASEQNSVPLTAQTTVSADGEQPDKAPHSCEKTHTGRTQSDTGDTGSHAMAPAPPQETSAVAVSSQAGEPPMVAASAAQEQRPAERPERSEDPTVISDPSVGDGGAPGSEAGAAVAEGDGAALMADDGENIAFSPCRFVRRQWA